MSLDLTEDKSTLLQVMAWCHQATSHYLSQCWPRSVSPYGIIGPQWVDHQQCYSMTDCWFQTHQAEWEQQTTRSISTSDCGNGVSFWIKNINRPPSDQWWPFLHSSVTIVLPTNNAGNWPLGLQYQTSKQQTRWIGIYRNTPSRQNRCIMINWQEVATIMI